MMTAQEEQSVKQFLDESVQRFNTPDFVVKDPISIPHSFSKKKDIEIAGFLVSIITWGKRASTIKSGLRLMELMQHAPHDFILHHTPADLKHMLGFAHRTFNTTDLLYFIETLQRHYRQHESLEDAFTIVGQHSEWNAGPALIAFHNYFFTTEHPERTRKHISTPARGSACKRLCMYLRWMVRKDESGVDFGIWKRISPAQLICPLDVHVARVAHRLSLTTRPNADWRSAEELTSVLRRWCPDDPAVYDYALFGLGAEERF